MKEKYFSAGNIDIISAGILEEIKKYSKPFTFNSDRTALLVLDMQKYFIDETSHAYIPSAKAIIKNINNLIDFFTENKLSIIYTKHINTKENAKMMSSWWNDIILQDNGMSEIIPEIHFNNGQVIVKSQYDAFYNTNLETMLKGRSIKNIIITGVMTHLCCENTARSAFVRGYRVLFPIDATATYNYSFHLASVLNLAHGYANVMLTEQIISSFDKGEVGGGLY